MQSCLYVGQVRHRRLETPHHRFAYRLFMVYLDLDEMPQVFKGRWLWSVTRPNLAWFRRSDHLGDPATPLGEAVRGLVASETGHRPEGPIRLLTHLRYFGFGFNPVSFYYCFDRTGERVKTIVAEVNNTPWGEQYCYVLRADQTSGRQKPHRFQLQKAFHVSPFMPMNLDYEWHFSTPDEDLFVHMQNFKATRKIFDATLVLRRRPLSRTVLAGALRRYPLMTMKVLGAIYYQALRLWLKRTPFYTHPNKLDRQPRKKELCHESRTRD